MNETEIINIIKNELNNGYIGDDCAYLKDLGIVISQDSLIENIHFKKEWYTPFQLGYKSVIVNISDILASGAKPAYITIALSLPKSIDNDFIENFYKGAKSALYGAQIVGGDITGSKSDIVISVTALGTTKGRKISSRKHAKPGYAVITCGNHGSSAAGLKELISGGNNKKLIDAHIVPEIYPFFSSQIAENLNTDYAMMDTSDGLADALFKIAEASGVKISADFNKIPHLKDITYQQVLFGGEDYKPVAAVPVDFVKNIKDCAIIGKVEKYDGTRLQINDKIYNNYFELNVYNHFGENND